MKNWCCLVVSSATGKYSRASLSPNQSRNISSITLERPSRFSRTQRLRHQPTHRYLSRNRNHVQTEVLRVAVCGVSWFTVSNRNGRTLIVYRCRALLMVWLLCYILPQPHAPAIRTHIDNLVSIFFRSTRSRVGRAWSIFFIWAVDADPVEIDGRVRCRRQANGSAGVLTRMPVFHQSTQSLDTEATKRLPIHLSRVVVANVSWCMTKSRY